MLAAALLIFILLAILWPVAMRQAGKDFIKVLAALAWAIFLFLAIATLGQAVHGSPGT